MNYKQLNEKTTELKLKFKSLQDYNKNENISKELSLKNTEEEKKIYKKFKFYQGLKDEVSKMACGKKGGKKR